MEPRFSVLVPVYEQWDLVPALLACLGAQSLPQDAFEVILVDNGSTHFTPPATLPPNTRIVTCTDPGSYAARNAAAAIAKGEWLTFTDADCLPGPAWLMALADAAQVAGEQTIVVGSVDVRPLDDRPNAYEIYDMIKGIPQERYASRGYGATANLAVSATLFHAVGGFDGKRLSGGDAEFCRRATAHGARIQFVAAARVGHPARSTWDAIAIKSRRVLGGQLAAGSFFRRGAFLVRALAPPVIPWWRLARAQQPLRYRAVALAVQTRLWGVDVLEAARLLVGGQAERR
jgi:GT2 family glycosyltransferase